MRTLGRVRGLALSAVTVAVLACVACTGDKITGPSEGSSNGGSRGTGSNGGTPTAGSSSATGMRTAYCTTLASYSNTGWVTIPRLDGLDVKLFWQGTFKSRRGDV